MNTEAEGGRDYQKEEGELDKDTGMESEVEEDIIIDPIKNLLQ